MSLISHHRVLLGTGLLMLLCLAGTVPGPAWMIWPFPLLWGSLAWSCYAPGPIPIVCLLALGLVQDMLHEAPLGSWSLAALAAFLLGHYLYRAGSGGQVPLSFWPRTFLTVGVAAIMLLVCAALAGARIVDGPGLLAGLGLTALFYPLARLVLLRRHDQPGWRR